MGKIIFSACLILSLTGCSPRQVLSSGLLKEYGLANANLSKLQLFLSDDLLLEQEATTINKDINESHSLQTVQDSRVKQVYFKKLTPCIATEISAERLCVSFETGDCLTFKLKETEGRKGIYIFQPESDYKDKNPPQRLPESGFRDWKKIGKQKYKEVEYAVLVEKEAPCLLIDEKELRKLEVDREVVPGMKLDTK